MPHNTRNYRKTEEFDPWPGYFKGGPVQPADEDNTDEDYKQDWKRDSEPELPQNRDKSIDREPDNSTPHKDRIRLPDGPWRNDEA